MNYVDLKNELKKIGINISIMTLRTYVKKGLIPAPARKHLGRGRGEQVYFPIEAIAEAGAAKLLAEKHRNPSAEQVKKARYIALEAIKHNDVKAIVPQRYKIVFAFEENKEKIKTYPFLREVDTETLTLAMNWTIYYSIIKQGFSLDEKLHIALADTVEVYLPSKGFEENYKKAGEVQGRGGFVCVYDP